MKENYYLLAVWGDVDPEIHGPYDTPEERDEAAGELRDSQDGGLYPITIMGDVQDVEVVAYAGGFFENRGVD